jgi:hypothetical protein
MDIFGERGFPRFGRVVERQRSARGDLRRGVRELQTSVNELHQEREDDN